MLRHRPDVLQSLNELLLLLWRHAREHRRLDDDSPQLFRVVLAQHAPFTDELVASVRQHHLVKDVPDDDVCDALVAAVSAKLCVANGTLTLPGVPDVDPRRLPMEMVYPIV